MSVKREWVVKGEPKVDSPPGTLRIKQTYIPIRLLMELLFNQPEVPSYINLPNLKLPDGYRVLAWGLDHFPMRIFVIVEHSSFEPVLEGMDPPQLESGWNWQMYVLATQEEVLARAMKEFEKTDEHTETGN